MEVKWAKSDRVDVTRDMEKLEAFCEAMPGATAYLCVFGRKSFVENIDMGDCRLKEKGKAVYADLRRTKYGCRIFQAVGRGNN